MSSAEILQGDALTVLRTLPPTSFQTCVTSPPYWGLRDYGCEGQLGLEQTPAEYVARLVEVFAEVWRVLRDDGCLWLNLGDSYAGGGNGGGGSFAKDGIRAAKPGTDKNVPSRKGDRGCCGGLKPKDLIGIPWRVAFALQDAGWYLRSDIIWNKPNTMPESVTDRPSCCHEHVFLFAKSERYFYDADAIREPPLQARLKRYEYGLKSAYANGSDTGRDRNEGMCDTERMGDFMHPGGRNKRNVWTVPTAAYSGAHFATFPPDLIRPMILAATSERGCCASCGDPWRRVVVREKRPRGDAFGVKSDMAGKDHGQAGSAYQEVVAVRTVGWQPGCKCEARRTEPPVPCSVLDPFAGSGTTGVVALQYGRRFTGIELSEVYAEMARKRLHKVAAQGMLELV